MITAGYSGTSLTKKLGIKNKFKIKLVHAPDYYFQLFSDLPPDIQLIEDNKIKKDFIHYFAEEAESFTKDILSLKNEMEQHGMMWVSWPKKVM
jgi:hypothetical protein